MLIKTRLNPSLPRFFTPYIIAITVLLTERLEEARFSAIYRI